MRKLTREDKAIGVVALLKVLFHVVTSPTFDREVNEYYFMEVSKRLDYGYFDVAPLGPLLWRGTRVVLGESLVAIRFPSALAGGAAALITGLMARRLGGGLFAQVFAATTMALCPWFVKVAGGMGLTAYEPFFWTLACLLFLIILQEKQPRLWPVLGLVLGLGALLKPSILLLAVGMGAGVLFTKSARGHLWRKEFWIGAVVAGASLLPMLVWDMKHDWASFAFGTSRRMPMNLPMVVVRMALLLSPLTLPVWVIGLVEFFRRPASPPLRAIGWMYVVVLAALLLAHGRDYYILSIHAVLFAGGATAVERWKRLWPKALVVFGVVGFDLFWLPLSLPLLSLERFDAYCRYAYPPLPKKGMYSPRLIYQGRDGWDETAAFVREVFDALPAEARESTPLIARRYRTAAPLNFYGPRYGLPRAISGDVQYWIWGPGPYETAERAVLIGFTDEEADKLFLECDKRVHLLATAEDEPATVLSCQKPRQSLRASWAGLRSLGEANLPNGEMVPLR